MREEEEECDVGTEASWRKGKGEAENKEKHQHFSPKHDPFSRY